MTSSFLAVRAKVYTDSTGACAVVLTSAGVLSPLLDYLLSRSHDRSLAWMKKVVRSTLLFLDYLAANPEERETYKLFQNFAQRLRTGTFDRVTRLDPSGLCWSPLSAHDCSGIVSQLTGLFDWLGATRPGAAVVNPRYAGDAYDRLMDEAAFQFCRSRAFLGHAWLTHATEPSGSRLVRAARTPRVECADPPQFPDDRFLELLNVGFTVNGRLDRRNVLIALLLHGAGFRASEPFHLFVSDVVTDPSNPRSALVRIHHPTFGAAPDDWRLTNGKRSNGNRAAYLAEKFGRVPRTEMMGSQHAGWKGGTHDGRFFKQAHWFVPEYGELFLKVWLDYMHDVAAVERSHPYAFINLRAEPKAGMYCVGQFNKAHRAACERIGLAVSKDLGTTPHGHRHAYGKRLTAGGVDKLLIRRVLHHGSMASQEVYTQPGIKEATKALRIAAARLQTDPHGFLNGSPAMLPPAL